MSTAAVESVAPTAVITAIAMVAAAREAAVVAIVPVVVAATDEAVGVAASIAVAPASIITASSVVAIMSVVPVAVITAATVEATAIVAAVVPGAGADEDAADEVVRSVEAVRSAGVRIVAVVTISAGGRRPDRAVHGTYSNAHGKLCMSVSRSEEQNPHECNIF
jgi:hypothetical protein